MDANAAPEFLPQSSSWGTFEPYAQLVRSLLPRASHVAVFDSAGELRWCSEAELGPDVLEVMSEASQDARSKPDSPGQLLLLTGNLPVYRFFIRDDSAELLAVVCIICRAQPESGGEHRTFSYVYSMLRPALECLRRDLIARAAIERLHRKVHSLDQDMALLLEDGPGAGAPSSQGTDELNGILQQMIGHLHGGYAALVVPDKSIALLSAAEGHTPDAQLVARTHRQLLALAQLRREPIIINGLTGGGTGGGMLPCRILCSPMRSGNGQSMGVMSLFRDMGSGAFTARDGRLAEVLARKAVAIIEGSYDSLSGLYARQVFEQRTAAVLAEPSGARDWCALYVDVDQLHVVNDNFGMHVGDGVLGQLGSLIRERLPRGAFGARISGDRFALLLPTQLDAAKRFAEALRQGAEKLGAMEGDTRVRVSISIGVAKLEPEGGVAHSLAAAETACKAAKDRGRNRVEAYHSNDVSIVRRFDDINIARQVREAVDTGRLRLDAQLVLPFAGAESARPYYELLLRMIGEQGEAIGPDRFLSAATRYQLMPDIDRWVIDHAIELLRPHAELLASRSLSFAINFSGQSFNSDEFPEFLIDRIARCGLDPSLFCFELTETATVASLPRAEHLMRRLRALGCGVALDDFGTGLSSLSYLRQLPVTMLKIDGSFVRDVLRDPRAESMVRAIAQLARSMSIATVAEYIETPEIRTRIATLGVDYGQGFAIARPVPLLDLLTELPMLVAATLPSPLTDIPASQREFVH